MLNFMQFTISENQEMMESLAQLSLSLSTAKREMICGTDERSLPTL